MNEIILPNQTALQKKSYDLLSKISENYLGAVYLATGPDHQKIILIVLNPFFSEVAKTKLNKLQKVVKLCSQLDSDEIILLKKVFVYKNRVCLVEEYFSGISIENFSFRSKINFDIPKLINLLNPIINFLCLMHERRLSHGSIRVDQILINQNLQVKLKGFKWESILLEDFKNDPKQNAAANLPAEIKYYFKNSDDLFAIRQLFLELIARVNKKFFLRFHSMNRFNFYRRANFYRYACKVVKEPRVLENLWLVHKFRKCKTLREFVQRLMNG